MKLPPEQQQLVRQMCELVNCNPFSPERLKLEKKILRGSYEPEADSWHLAMNPFGARHNVRKLLELSEDLAGRARQSLLSGSSSQEAVDDYHHLVYWMIYHQHNGELESLIACSDAREAGRLSAACFASIAKSFRQYIEELKLMKFRRDDLAHIFACFFQVRRAFHHIFTCITGSSKAATRLRMDTWNSIFTHDILRYQRCLQPLLRDIPTLVCGPSGSGKELVARAIALSGYIPFDAATQRFKHDHHTLLHAVNISAMSPQLVESELFGHRRGSFTGALQDHLGWFSLGDEYSSLFLDEIGDLAADIQVKLLRVLQSRTYQAVGDTQTRHFRGRILAATNLDLPREIAAGRFRADFYYRLCANVVRTPSLAEILAEQPGDLAPMVAFVCSKWLGPAEAELLKDEVLHALESQHLRHHRWPGNFRELEQCVKSVLAQGHYTPDSMPVHAGDKLGRALAEATLSVDELLGHYCKRALEVHGTYEEAARILQVDRRTLKARAGKD